MSKQTPYLLTPQARQSLRETKRWSRARWGEAQTKHYFEDLDKAACYIAANQTALAARDDLTGTPELGIYPVREHYLIYVALGKQQIALVDVIRQSRDVPAILAQSAPLIRRELKAIKESIKRT
jgi:plasmid stabilization system protein ParE